MIKSELLRKLKVEFRTLEEVLTKYSELILFEKSAKKSWSIAENIQHLILTTKPLTFLFKRTEIMLQTWGNSNRKSGEYSDIKELYVTRIGTPGYTTKAYKPAKNDVKLEDLILDFRSTNKKLIQRTNLLTDKELDTYQIPHPLIGLITCKEFLYFTLYHTIHHKKTIMEIFNTK